MKKGKKTKKERERIFEIDFFRGIAVILMVYFHIVFDLKEFYGANVSYNTGYNYYLGIISGSAFIIISGVSSSLSGNNLRRGLKIFALGMLLTAITNVIGRGTQIYFGVLHLLGISMILAHFILKLSSKAWLFIVLILSGIIIFGNRYVNSIKIDYNYMMMLGFKNKNFYSADYYPLVPWFGVFLIGIIAGKILYENKRSFLPFLSKWGNNPINYSGKHSLVIYLIHQPVILLILEVLNRTLK